MNKSQYDNLEKLCKALESGTYKQGNNSLKIVDGTFCCLGVALDLLYPDGWGYLNSQQFHSHGVWSFDSEEPKCHYMNQSAALEFGLTDDDQSNLAHLNDLQKPFKHIAKHIRENIMTRFVPEVNNAI